MLRRVIDEGLLVPLAILSITSATMLTGCAASHAPAVTVSTDPVETADVETRETPPSKDVAAGDVVLLALLSDPQDDAGEAMAGNGSGSSGLTAAGGRPSAGGIGGVGGAGGATTGGSRPRTTRRGGGAERTDRLTKGTIRRVVRRAVAQFRRCYERALTTQPTLKGTVLSSFVIGTTGLVESVTFRSSTLKSSATERCIKGVFARLQFPKPDHGGVVRVRYPLTFSPTGSGTKASAGTGQTKAAAAAAAAPNTARVKQTSP